MSLDSHLVVAGVPSVTSTSEMLVRFWPREDSCAAARSRIRDFCGTRHLTHLVDDAELLTSELVCNAIRRATSFVTLVATETEGTLVVGVRSDSSGDLPPAPDLPEDTDEHGRGLFVVAQIADNWGFHHHAGATTVWFRLR